MGKVQVALVGAGQIAKLHARRYIEDERVDLCAVCDVREEQALSAALDWGADRCYTMFKEVLEDERIDAVAILTPSHLHAPFVMEALRAGKHVHVARPLALSLSEADKLIHEAKRRGLILEVAEPMLCDAPLREARAYLNSGEIGDPIGVRVRVNVGSPDGGWKVDPESWLWRFDPQKSGGGPFLFDVTHGVFVASSYLLGRIELVQAWIGRTEIYPGYHVDAPATMMWRHGRGVVGSLDVMYSPDLFVKSTTYPHETMMEVTGTRGLIRVLLSPGRLSSREPLEMNRDGRVFTFGEVESNWEKNFGRSVEGFLSLLHGEGNPICPGGLGRAHLELTLAARDSSLGQRARRIGV